MERASGRTHRQARLCRALEPAARPRRLVILPQPPLLLITDRHQARRPLEEVVAAALGGGCRWISLREKDLSHEARVVLLGRLVALGRARDATIMVHGDVEAAVAASAAGVHLPAGGSPRSARLRLGAHALVGVSTHSRAEVEAAVAAGTDYVSLSPIFASASKPGYGPPLGLSNLRRIAQEFEIPILALSGISIANAAQCLAAGAAGVAVMGFVMRAADPGDAICRLIAALGSMPGMSISCQH
ncbi:MAG: thiamine phosphate synthase [Dongiaceae bacterium]